MIAPTETKPSTEAQNILSLLEDDLTDMEQARRDWPQLDEAIRGIHDLEWASTVTRWNHLQSKRSGGLTSEQEARVNALRARLLALRPFLVEADLIVPNLDAQKRRNF